VFICGLLSVLFDQPSPPPDGAAPLLELPPDEPPPLAVQAVRVIAAFSVPPPEPNSENAPLSTVIEPLAVAVPLHVIVAEVPEATAGP
jgi:hypothetical protein